MSVGRTRFLLLFIVSIASFSVHARPPVVSADLSGVGGMSASHPSLWDSTKKTIKAVIGRDTLGTGVTIVGKGLILAAYHTLSNQEGCDHVQFVFWKPGESSRSYPCRKIISSDPENDYTLAETEGDPSEFYPVAQIDPRPLSPEELGREKWTIVTTHSVSSRKVRRCGFYNPQLDPHSPSFLRPLPPDAPAPNYVAVSCDAPDAVVVGDSGSAVFDQSGSLAGQLSYQLNHDPSKGGFVPISRWYDKEKQTLNRYR